MLKIPVGVLSDYTCRGAQYVKHPGAKKIAAVCGLHITKSANMMNIPLSVLTDSYKASHFLQYPDAKKLVAYGEFRTGYNHDKEDTRLVSYGIRYIIENYVSKQWTLEDVRKADQFYSTHLAPAYGAYPFPKPLFEKFVKENNGFFPVVIEAIPEGTCIHSRIPVYQIIAEDEYAHLCTFLETLLTMVWYPTTVATLSRRAKDIIEQFFELTSEGGKANPLVATKLHDFGFRGCTTVEQSVIGGCAHLLNFLGTDTLSAAYYAQFNLNNGKPVAQSVPASEHSVMTSWKDEKEAMENMIDKFGEGIYSIVMDSYDYQRALNEVLPSVAAKKVAKGGHMVLRPDSGDPLEAVIQGLEAAEKVFGITTNSKGYKLLNNCSVLQGDGINIDTLRAISKAAAAKGYAAENVTFGMGGGLLQKVNRDTMSFATKLNYIEYANGTCRDAMKMPQGESGKFSLPGILSVKRVQGIPTVFPRDSGEVRPEENMLQVVYNKGVPVDPLVWQDFDTLRQRVASEWSALPPVADNISATLRAKIQKQLEDRRKH